MFRRKIYDELADWKNRYNGKYACLVEGARRVRKSTIVEEFAKKNYKSYIKVDFSKAGEKIMDVFKDITEPDIFFARLQLETKTTLYKRDSCLIFDEIQLYPKARQAIKHLVADGRYDYIETGSLISIRKNVSKILIPSEEHKLSMYPMDFEEFCWATGENYELFVELFKSGKPIGENTNRSLLRRFRIYMAIGGMPQAVQAYVDKENFNDIDSVKQEILDLYKDDLMKIDSSGYTSAMLDSIPAQLALNKKRFVLSAATGKRTTAKDKERFYNLLNSKIVIPCYNVTNPIDPFSLTADYDCFKLYMADTGLFTTLVFNSQIDDSEEIYNKLLSNKLSANLGFMYENAAAQIISSSGRTLYYHTWAKENSTHTYEIDFLIEKKNKAIPIEVKSSATSSHDSLDDFCRKYSKHVSDRYLFSQKDTRDEASIKYRPIYLMPAMIQSL